VTDKAIWRAELVVTRYRQRGPQVWVCVSVLARNVMDAQDAAMRAALAGVPGAVAVASSQVWRVGDARPRPLLSRIDGLRTARVGEVAA